MEEPQPDVNAVAVALILYTVHSSVAVGAIEPNRDLERATGSIIIGTPIG